MAGESPYPYHPETGLDIKQLSETALQKAFINSDDLLGLDPFLSTVWRVPRLGFACRLDRPAAAIDESVSYTLSFEDHQPGQRDFGRRHFIAAGRRTPVARNPHNYGILDYSPAKGLLKEPTGILPNNYLRHIVHVKDMDDPEQRVTGFEALLKELLGYAPRGWEEPLR